MPHLHVYAPTTDAIDDEWVTTTLYSPVNQINQSLKFELFYYKENTVLVTNVGRRTLFFNRAWSFEVFYEVLFLQIFCLWLTTQYYYWLNYLWYIVLQYVNLVLHGARFLFMENIDDLRILSTPKRYLNNFFVYVGSAARRQQVKLKKQPHVLLFSFNGNEITK